MKRPLVDYACYLPDSPGAEAWGVVVRGAGRITSLPKEAYPPPGHPQDHEFQWAHGRVLGAWQIVVIVGGAGEFESRAGGRQPVRAGDVLWIVPGEWHRYRPDPRSGWVEQWVELEGSVAARLSAGGRLKRQCAVYPAGAGRGVGEAVTALLGSLGRDDDSAREATLAAAGLRVLGGLASEPDESPLAEGGAVRRALEILRERLVRPPSMPALARELRVGYVSFRREFKRATGLAPRQYLLRLRLERAQRLLGVSRLTLEAIAEEVGFSSAFHLSSAFKTQFGVAPAVWRRGGRKAG